MTVVLMQNWLSAGKKFKGEDSRPLFFLYCFSKILGGKRLLGGDKSRFGGRHPPAPCSRKPAKCLVSLKMANLKMLCNLHCVRARLRLRSNKL